MKLALLNAVALVVSFAAVAFSLGWLANSIYRDQRDRKLAAKLKRASDDLAKAVENNSQSLGPDQPGTDKQNQ